MKLSDGTEIPSSTFINMAAEPLSRDPAYYDDPSHFKGDRFYNATRVGGKSSHSPENEFSGIERGNIAWGNGRLTCPGRWYASALNKLILGTILEQYDVRFPEGQVTRPPNIYNDGGIMPDPKQIVMFHSRKAGNEGN